MEVASSQGNLTLEHWTSAVSLYFTSGLGKKLLDLQSRQFSYHYLKYRETIVHFTFLSIFSLFFMLYQAFYGLSSPFRISMKCCLEVGWDAFVFPSMKSLSVALVCVTLK